MAPITEVVNVSLIAEGQLAARDNMNVVSILTSEVGFLSTAKRYALYSDAASVAADFGSDSAASDYAQVFFSQSPNPVNAGGVLVMGYWRAAEEAVAASAAALTGVQISEATIIAQLQAISDGSMDIDVDGATEALSALDFRAVTDFAGVVAVLNTALAGATASEDDQKIVITSDTTGVLSLIDFPVAGAAGTFIGNILGIADGTGATTVQGAAASVIALETKEAAITALKALVNFKGFMFIDNPTDLESKALAEWAQANNTLSYDVFDAAANLYS